ncbi:unnamed protein product [Absidia cylindrospora]
MLSPVVGTSLLEHQLSWKWLYGFLSCVSLINLLVITVGLRQTDSESPAASTLIDDDTASDDDRLSVPFEQTQIDKSTKEIMNEAILNRTTLLCAIYILIYVGLEVTLGGWGYTYLVEGKHGDPISMGKVLSMYWAALAIGRIILGYISGRYGERTSVTIFTLLTLVGIFCIWKIDDLRVDATVFVLIGALLGPMFPTAISLAAKTLPKEMHPTSMGFIAGVGASGAAFLPFLTGQIAGHYGMLCLPIALVVILITYNFHSTIYCLGIRYHYPCPLQQCQFETLLKHIQKTRLVPVLNALETGTFFAPDNDAFVKYQGPPITNETLLYHLLPRKISAKKFRPHQVIETSLQLENYLQNNTGQRVLIHQSPTQSSSLAATFSKSRRTFFVNDAQLIDMDLPVNPKTVIHAVNKILQPPPMIPQTFTHRNIDLYQMMEKVGLIRTLNQHQPFTVFYSDQSILQPFSDVEIAYLLSNYGDQDLLTLLGYLIIHGDVYADDFSGEKQYKTVNGDTLTIKVDKEKNTITVNDEPIIQKDILAANGVLHRLETMPITQRLTFDTRKYLYGINATKFVSLLDEYDLGYYLAPGVTNFTVLAPDNNAINEGSIPDNVKKAWLSYHLLHGRWDRNLLEDRLLIASEYKSPQLKKQSQVVPVYLPEGWKSTIYFGNARVHGDSLTIKDNMIYQLSNPMDLPHDVFSSIVIDLDLSSFIATLYVSEVVDQIKDAAGISLFAPTNQAYKSLGLVATYLLHPNGRRDLQATLQHHAAQALLYDHDLRTSTHNVTTLTGQDTLSVGGTDDQGRIMIGSGGSNNSNGTILHTNTLMANGVIHKIDTVIIPSSVSLTHRKILKGMDAHRVLDWFNDFPWLGRDDAGDDDSSDSGLGEDYILLVPTDRAFAQMDEELGAGWEVKDHDAYERLVRLHVIPKEQQKQRHTLLGGRIESYPTLLSDRDRIIVHDGGYFDEQYVQVDGKTGQGAYARILAKGNLGEYAQVIQMDTVLMPVARGLFGLPWIWSVALVSILIVVGVSLLGGIGYYLWQRYRRSGYEPIEEEPEQEQEQGSSTINNNNTTNNHENHDNNTTNNTTISNTESGISDPYGSQYPPGPSGPSGPGPSSQA